MVNKKIKISFIILNSFLSLFLIILVISFIIFNYLNYQKQGKLLLKYNHENKMITNSINKLLDRYDITKLQLIDYIDSFEDMPFGWPIKENKNLKILETFGLGISKKFKCLDLKTGNIIEAPKNSKVVSTAFGIVEDVVKLDKNYEFYYDYYSDTDYESEGYAVIISHKYGFISIYSNLNRINNVIIKRGELIKKGDVIGFLGNNNNFLYYSIRVSSVDKGRILNPNDFLFIDK